MLNYNIIRNIFCYFDNTNEKIRFLDAIFNIDDFDYAMKNWFKKYEEQSIFDPIKPPLSGDFDYVDVLFDCERSIYIPDDIEKLNIILKYDKRPKYNDIVKHYDINIYLFSFFSTIINKDYKLLCKHLPDFRVIAYQFICYSIGEIRRFVYERDGKVIGIECLFDIFNKYFETDEKYYEDFLNYVIEFWPMKPNMLNIFKYVFINYDINKKVISADNLFKTMLVNYSGHRLFEKYAKDIIIYHEDVDRVFNEDHSYDINILTYYDVTKNIDDVCFNNYNILDYFLLILKIVVNKWHVVLDKSFKKIILNKCLDYCTKLKLKDCVDSDDNLYGLNSINYDNDMNGIFAEYESFFKIATLFNSRF